MGPKVRKRLSITDSDVNKYSSSAKKRKKLEEKSPVKKKNAEEKSVKKDNREEKSPAKKKKIENCSDQPASSQALSSSEVSDVCKKGHVRNEKSPKLKSVNCQELVAKDISITSDINSMNINQLLALGESLEIPDLENDKSSELSDSEESDFEEVKHTEIKNHEIPKEGVSVILEVPHLKRRDKKSLDAEALIKREVNKVKKGIQLLMHKVHVLCWIAHLKFVNNVLNSPPLMKSCSALVKSKNLYPPKYADLTYLEGVIKWFHKTILFEQGHAESKCIAEELLNQINQKKAHLSRDLTLIFIALLRVLGLKARIVMSFQVLPVKPTSNELLNFKAANKNEKAKEDILNNKQKISIKQENDVEHLNKTHNEVSLAQQCENDTNVKKSATTKRASKKKNELASDQGVASKEVLVSAKSDLSEKNKISSKNEDKKMKANYQSKSKKVQCISGDKESKSSFKTSKNSGTKSSTSTNKKQSESYQSEDSLSDSDDDNFVYKSLQKKVKKKVGRPSTSNNEETSATKKKEGCNVWTEVFLESEEKWISVDVQRQKVHCINELYVSRSANELYFCSVLKKKEYTCPKMTK